jgi:ketosteroid isomerase-like protein
MQRILTSFLSIAVLVASFGPAAAQSADLAAEEAAIRELDRQWVTIVGAKNAAATTDFYAEDGAILPPGTPIAEGRQAIATVWGGFYKLANFELTFAPRRITIAQAGDIAFEMGTYRTGASMRSPGGGWEAPGK